MQEEEIKLKVQEALGDYIGKGIITMSVILKQKLGIISGDVIEIMGEKKTVAQVWPEKNNPLDENIIRMDQYTRQNAGVTIGDIVSVKKINPQIAQEIVLVPLKEVNLLSDNYDLIIKRSFLGRPFLEGNTIMINVFGTGYLYYIKETKPAGAVILSDATNFVVSKKPITQLKAETFIGYEDVGGLRKQMDAVKEMVELPFKYPELFNKLNVTPPKGILLYGPPGTGKTLLAKALSNELKANFIAFDAPQIMAKYVGEAEERLRQIFKKAQSKTPAIIFIDEIDAIAPKRENLVNEVEKRVVAQLLASMDGMSNRGDVIVIGATNRSSDIDPALRRPGRFDREINISVPDEEGRLDILKIHTRNVPLDKNVSLIEISKVTHGFVGADLAHLVKEAAIISIKRAVKDIDIFDKKKKKEEIPLAIIEKLCITKDDFSSALKLIQPSGLREVFVEVSDIDYSNIGAMKHEKEIMKDIINLNLKKKDLLDKMNIKPQTKILLYGLPGTGKTMFVKASAKEFKVNFIYVKGPEVLDKYLGESEKTIRSIFKKAKEVSPCILFFDEIDSITRDKEGSTNQTKVLDQLLSELDNLAGKDIVFVAASNRPDLIDKSFLRSGRIDKIIEFKVPEETDRKEIIEVLLKKIPHDKINVDLLVKKTIGFTGADLQLLITDSVLLAIKESDYKETKLKEKQITQILEKMKKNLKDNNNSSIYDSFKEDRSIARYIQWISCFKIQIEITLELQLLLPRLLDSK